MNDVDINIRIEHALVRSKVLSSKVRQRSDVFRRHRFGKPSPSIANLTYGQSVVHVKRVVFTVEQDDEMGRWRSAFAKSRSALYERLSRQFGGDDDCGCDG